jgi:DNA modification methylase
MQSTSLLPDDDVTLAVVTEQPNSEALDAVSKLNSEFEKRYHDKLVLQKSLSRSLVSFQSNKGCAFYRWFKYKEGFSAALVDYLLHKGRVAGGKLLDPFAGAGTALFAARDLGIDAEGIELLPIGQEIIATKMMIDGGMTDADLIRLKQWRDKHPWLSVKSPATLNELRITKDAYSADSRAQIGQYLAALNRESGVVQSVLRFTLLCVLESISFTRKDGQYLRWDYRSGRRQGSKPFNKGKILAFGPAISAKLDEILSDVRADAGPRTLFDSERKAADVHLHRGSCLDVLPQLASDSYDCILTSPPYCNRYDYTRTYALELALQGVQEDQLVQLRQNMLSCTVENRSKDLVALNSRWSKAIEAADAEPLLQSILAYLEDQRRLDLLNNNGIPRMVRGYFYEMACVVSECARVLKRGAPLIMVNDNVRYAGAAVSVDIILSEMATRLGFEVESILVLPTGKGNSSQQMGAHGREPLRKCVYLWRKR